MFSFYLYLCVSVCAGVVPRDASRVSSYLDSDGLPRIGVLLKEGDPYYRWGRSPDYVYCTWGM